MMGVFIHPHTDVGLEVDGVDICRGADPYIFHHDGQWNLLLQGDHRQDPLDHDGIRGYVLRRAPTIEDLRYAPAINIQVGSQSDNLKQVWAAEIFDNYMYVAASRNGDNKTHRIYAYETNGNMIGPWRERGIVHGPPEDDSWAIDMSMADIPFNGKIERYAVWSGWETPDDEFPQNIYIAKAISPVEIGKRKMIAQPEGDWCTSVKPLLEGPQALVIDGEFRGLLVSGNASWTEKYATRILKFMGGDPMMRTSWKLVDQPFLPDNRGIAHGMMVEDNDKLFFIGHRKTSLEPGWHDRFIFYKEIEKENFLDYLDSVK